ncbi:TPA: hypothetical protein ACVMZV_002291 [Pseudomonas aeruginosa]|nr:hypothetical protein [Pseudomonas aeruginosa]
MHEVLAFLSALRELHPDMPRWGLHGGCFRVYLVLKNRFPEAEPWYDGDHVLTRIAERFYDIRGEVQPNNHQRMDPLVFNRAYDWHQPALSAEQAAQEQHA